MRHQHRVRRLHLELAIALLVGGCSAEDGSPWDGGGSTGGAGASATAGTSATAGASTAGTAGVAPNGGQGGSSAGSGGNAGGAGGGTGGAGGSAGSSAGQGGAGGSSSAGTSSGGAGGKPAKFCGNITTAGQVRSDFGTYWDQITPENEGKWGSVEGTRDKMNWAGIDRAHDYAKSKGIPFKQHNFVWGSQQPSWLNGLGQAEQKEEVEEWIRLYCERYPDTQLIDVVNEPPPHTTPPYTAALGGAGASGYDWIVQSFKWAHQYCPNAILILNDYNTIELAGDNSHFIDIVNRIKMAGAPIHALGAQAHGAYNLPTATVKMYIDKLATSTGLPVYISEYDINLADDAKQKEVMESQFTMFWNDENVHGVTIWGYVNGRTWLPNTGLMTSDGKERPALTWLKQFLNR
jgi:endo-1,4-beta-xylanase